jgi:hypothetical protein
MQKEIRRRPIYQDHRRDEMKIRTLDKEERAPRLQDEVFVFFG